MALLNAQDRFRTAAQYAREQPIHGQLLKPDFRAALAAVDQWIDDNRVFFVAALPEPYKTLSTAQDKVMLLTYVLLRKVGRLTAQEDG
jgi:hypothetical protein